MFVGAVYAIESISVYSCVGTYVKMVKKSYWVSFDAVEKLRFVAGVLVLDFQRVVTLSLAACASVVIESCATNHFKLLVVVIRASNTDVAETSRYCFYFVADRRNHSLRCGWN